jgi:hypothetical protein
MTPAVTDGGAGDLIAAAGQETHTALLDLAGMRSGQR